MKAPTIDRWIDSQAAKIVRKDINKLEPLLSIIIEKARSIDPQRHPRLGGQIEVMISFLQANYLELSQPVRECAVALLYLHKKHDVIPDNIDDIGYADDAFVCDRIFLRNRAVQGFNRKDLQHADD